jgi:hypothetical protein
MAGGRRLRNLEYLHGVADTDVTPAEKVKDPKAGAIRKTRRLDPSRLVAEVTDPMEPALGIEPRTC